jgi:cellulose synthase/poly-beta-1,6-N-acetylglucosamine synthase-like glycosyltransferase
MKDYAMKVMIGIVAYNEGANIGKVLDVILGNAPPEVESIKVVSSGSTDETDSIVKSYEKKDSRIHLVTEPKRNGKAAALNILLSDSEKYDYIICLGGDNIPKHEAIDILVDELKKKDVDIVGGKPEPLNNEKSFLGFCAYLQWNLHHAISMKNPPKISGEMMAFRSGVIRKLPPKIINDDAYIQQIFEMRGLRLKYVPEAIVYLKGPTKIREFIKQRRRIFVGHKQIKTLLGKDAPTMIWPKWSCIMEASPFRTFKGKIYAIGFLVLQGIAYILASFDFYLGKFPYIWPTAKTTKRLS